MSPRYEGKPNTQPFGHRLHRLTPPVQQQPTHICRALVPLITTHQRREHLRRELLQPPANGGQLPRSHASIATRGRRSDKTERSTTSTRSGNVRLERPTRGTHGTAAVYGLIEPRALGER